MGKNVFQIVENGVVVASATASTTDFVPVVKINEDEELEEGMYTIENCDLSKREKLTLSNEFDAHLREYIVPEIVIAKNSISKIPLKIIRGYDPGGTQDDDGIVEVICSNKDVTIEIENGEEEKEKREKEVTHGDEIILNISHKLSRGTKFSVDIKGKDDDDFFKKSDLIVTAGKLNFTVIEKDVFFPYEGQRILDENKDLVWDNWFDGSINYISGTFDEVCVRVADKQFCKLVENEEFVLKSYSNLTGMDRANDYKTKGYVKSSKKFTQKETWVRVDSDDFDVKPISYRKGKESVFTDYIKPEIENKIGYHVYYYVLLSGYHVLMILIDNQNPCKPMYKILDQIKDRPFRELKELNNDLLTMAKSNYEYAVKKVRKVNPEAKSHGSDMLLWKLKRK